MGASRAPAIVISRLVEVVCLDGSAAAGRLDELRKLLEADRRANAVTLHQVMSDDGGDAAMEKRELEERLAACTRGHVNQVHNMQAVINGLKDELAMARGMVENLKAPPPLPPILGAAAAARADEGPEAAWRGFSPDFLGVLDARAGGCKYPATTQEQSEKCLKPDVHDDKKQEQFEKRLKPDEQFGKCLKPDVSEDTFAQFGKCLKPDVREDTYAQFGKCLKPDVREDTPEQFGKCLKPDVREDTHEQFGKSLKPDVPGDTKQKCLKPDVLEDTQNQSGKCLRPDVHGNTLEQFGKCPKPDVREDTPEQFGKCLKPDVHRNAHEHDGKCSSHDVPPTPHVKLDGRSVESTAMMGRNIEDPRDADGMLDAERLIAEINLSICGREVVDMDMM